MNFTVMNFARQSWVLLTNRYLRQLYRQPAVIGITLTQPVIWLLLFGALFRNVAEIPGFGGGNYITYLTPGVVIMTALFSASWTGMSYIEDASSGVMDRFLTAPIPRSVLISATLAYQAVTTVVQSAIIIAIGWGTGATFPGGARDAHCRVHHAGDAADVPVRGVPLAAAGARLDRRDRQVQPGELGGQRRARGDRRSSALGHGGRLRRLPGRRPAGHRRDIHPGVPRGPAIAHPPRPGRPRGYVATRGAAPPAPGAGRGCWPG